MYVSSVKVSKSIQIWLWEQKFELLLTYFLQDILQMVVPFINEFTINLTLAMSQRIKGYSSNNDLNFRDIWKNLVLANILTSLVILELWEIQYL